MSTTWPALILAASRKDRVIGRRRILAVSIKTRKGFSQSGAPEGRSEAAKYDGEFLIDEMISANHIGSPSLSVKRRCLVELNTYGSSPIRFIEINMMNSAVRKW